MAEIIARQAVPVEQTWDATRVFATEADFEAAFRAIESDRGKATAFQGRLADSASFLANYLDFATDIIGRVSKITVYASLFHNVDTGDSEAAARDSRARTLFNETWTLFAFAEPEILAIGAETLTRWTKEEPRLAVYAHSFDSLIRRAEHLRSAEVEELLGQLAEPFGGVRRIHASLADTDLKFLSARSSGGDLEEIGQGTINTLLASPDRETRRTAWGNYADSFLGVQNTAANCLSAGVKQNVFTARARNYENSLDAALTGKDIPVEVFHNLIATFRENLPTWHRYWDLRRRALKLETLHPWDFKAPLSGNPPDISYEQAVALIAEGMAPLGEEYVAILKRGALEERWVDYAVNRGKRMGAYSNGTQGVPPYILMSYNEGLGSLSTLAHELGHSLHSYYTWQNQPPVYARYSLFVAEVASNFNQAMVRAHLLATQTDRDFQIAILEEAMGNFHRYFFIMPTLARFELEIHERTERGEALTAQSLNALMASLFAEGFGDAVTFDTDRIGITWAQFPTHLYSNFYVYQYATGISGAHALAEGVLAGKPNAAENYLAFLKAGSSLYPLDALKLAGVDLSSPEPVRQTFAVLADIVNRLETLVGNPA